MGVECGVLTIANAVAVGNRRNWRRLLLDLLTGPAMAVAAGAILGTTSNVTQSGRIMRSSPLSTSEGSQ